MRQPNLCRAACAMLRVMSSSMMNWTARDGSTTMHFCRTWFACGHCMDSQTCPCSSFTKASRASSDSASSSARCTRRQPTGSRARPTTWPSTGQFRSSCAARPPPKANIAAASPRAVSSVGFCEPFGTSSRSSAGRYPLHGQPPQPAAPVAPAAAASLSRRALMGVPMASGRPPVSAATAAACGADGRISWGMAPMAPSPPLRGLLLLLLLSKSSEHMAARGNSARRHAEATARERRRGAGIT
mmetsp:Transcript_107368/g.309118  ORF Transcript_107368/g.309118 Transcript_107368/m.309118 type:complete len:243 (-) Transcript_107368:14-742(-)